jgi:hypothetical protein
MPNPHRGEIAACLDGKTFRLCLTLGALAELEQSFGGTDMVGLAERFQSGRLKALDAQRIIGAGLRGAGHEILDEAVGRMQAEGGAAGFVDIVARLLGATFGGPVDALATATLSSPSAAALPVHAQHGFAMTRAGDGLAGDPAPAEGRGSATPFPGAT